jgi:hypothetical protein
MAMLEFQVEEAPQPAAIPATKDKKEKKKAKGEDAP